VEAIVTAAVLALLMAGAWSWQQAILRSHKKPSVTEPWQQVRERFPMPGSFPQAAQVPPALLEAVVRANPFSSQRRQVPYVPTVSSEGPTAAPAQPARPQFVYKGHILMGAKPRAIVEDLTTKKTHFLQVGQTVARFTVLEVSETRVVLSDPQTHEEVVVSLTPKPRP